MNKIDNLDVLIIGRGGGSIEDLWAFNEELVARAISKSILPIISAVGHEVDFTIADFVADLRAPTPSAAAELVVPVLNEINQELNKVEKRIIEAVKKQVETFKDLLEHLMKRRFFTDPTIIFNTHAQHLDDLNNQLFRGLNQWLILKEQKLSGRIQQLCHLNPIKNFIPLKEKIGMLDHRLSQNINSIMRLEIKRFGSSFKNLNALSPLGILERGYSITSFQGQALIKSDKLKQGDSINIQLAKGRLECTVDKIIKYKNKTSDKLI